MKTIRIVTLLLFTQISFGQTKVYTQDITNFYETFDMVHKNSSAGRSQQLAIVQTNYVDKASDGLKEFIRLGGANTERWLNYIQYNEAYLREMRPYIEAVSQQIPMIEAKLLQLKKDYPAYKDGQIFFIMGVGFVGGSPDYATNNLILGTEVVVKKNAEWAIPTAIHEFVHIQQQTRGNFQLLTQCVVEGVAEFLSELYFEKSLADNGYAPHIKFGNKNEKEIWRRFKGEAFSLDNGFLGWLYAAKNINGKAIQDLGYFVGYQICKTFYEQSTDKSITLKTLLELNVSSNEAIKDFLLKSGYVPKEDFETIKNSNFSAKKIENNIKKVIYGYSIKGNDVVFDYEVPANFLERVRIAIVGVSVAGSFNAWNPKDEKFFLTKKSKNHYQLILPKTVFKQEEQFKFIINGDIWMPLPEQAINVENSNLLLTLK